MTDIDKRLFNGNQCPELLFCWKSETISLLFNKRDNSFKVLDAGGTGKRIRSHEAN